MTYQADFVGTKSTVLFCEEDKSFYRDNDGMIGFLRRIGDTWYYDGETRDGATAEHRQLCYGFLDYGDGFNRRNIGRQATRVYKTKRGWKKAVEDLKS